MSFDRPMAGPGLHSYRYRSLYGYVMIGAKGTADALREAKRSIDGVAWPWHLETWDGEKYVQS